MMHTKRCGVSRGLPVPRNEQGQPAEVLLDIQRRALNGIALVAERALAKEP